MTTEGEGAMETEEEVYYNKLYERKQYQKSKSAKCAKKVEQIQELKINRVKSAKIKLPWDTYLSNNIQKLQSRLQTHTAFKECEDFFNNINDGQDPKLKDLNIELKTQRLLRKAEEIKQVENQVLRQKENNVYKILNKV